MNEQYEQIEEDLVQDKKFKRPMKKSGRSVLVLKRIIENKGGLITKKEGENEKDRGNFLA